MNTLFEKDINCPYCGESISILIDCSADQQEYIEDCQVCCRPITFKIQSTDGDEPLITLLSEDEI